MSTTNDTNPVANDAPYTPAPEADDPSRGKEVFAPTNGPFEAPAKTFVPGPYYMGIEERMPEVAQRDASEATEVKAGNKKGFSVDRRDFMKLFSVSSMAAASACVRRPLEKVVPYVNQPIDQYPGEPVYYATTCGECSSGCGVMVKTREGRPVKIEGVPGHPINNGRMCTVGQSTLQTLYHPNRQKQPMIKFGSRMDKVTWDDVYAHLGARLEGKKVAILTNGSTGHRLTFFREFLEKTGSAANRLYTYESNTLAESVAAAHQIAFGVQALPRADLHKAKTIVGIGSDFLDVGYSLLFHMRSYTDGHGYYNGTKNRHVQLEAGFTQTGARADERLPIPPGSETLVTLLLVRSLLDNKAAKGSSTARAQITQVLEQKAGLLAGGYERVGVKKEFFDQLATDLLAAPSVVMAGGSYSFDENATNLQLAAIMANELIGAYDSVLQLQKGWMTSPVVPGDLQRFLADAEAGAFDTLFVIDVDPTFSVPTSWGVEATLKKIPMIVSMQTYPAQIDKLASYVLNINHYLESWGDEQPVAGFWSLRQPTVRITTDSRQAEEALMWVAATMKKPLGYQDYRDFLRKKWAAVHQVAGGGQDFDTFWNETARKGFVDRISTQAIGEISSSLAANFKYVDAGRGGLRLIAPLDYRLHDGKFAHRPILQETQDALTTITWDTWVAMNPTTMQKLGFKENDVVKVEGPAGSFEAALYPLPGLHADAVVVPRGNGHTDGSLVEKNNGVNPLVAVAKGVDSVTGAPVTVGQAVKLTRTGAIYILAKIQKHNDIANRTDIVKKVGLATAQANKDKTKDLDKVPDLFPAIPNQEYKWGMAIDLSRCTGCGACQVACHTENNVPQVGREQILLGREMYWMRLDRYFYGSTDAPTVTIQPMLCQHCNQAPCEGVCPVYATTHDPEGVNQMTYNRCIGTRYCANACPYKIRRFNWWTHKWGVIGERPQDRNPRAMNPDVTVRTRGVMEKCQFCYQRVRDAKHKVKMRKTPLVDGELQVACQQTCPTDAIVFGDLLDPNSRITAMRKDFRAYLALGGSPEHGEYGLKTLPSVNYMAEVTLNEQEGGPGHGGKGHGGEGHGGESKGEAAGSQEHHG